ncbi:AMP-binding protein [Variovorax sp. J22R115]|uniref:AMP-binding protein n=1 Tax=Variovorax sp. J22R115 TaxID=3053509 RepID=UPI00257789C5|nr:AMP-binding protein [Variovorax sp. J22R115]MDM0047559.1 AMP-binding protein [Variovorax sp. J22R115]
MSSNRKPWLASYGSMPAEIDADVAPSVVALAEAAMTQFADKTAFQCLGQSLSYAEVDRQSRAFAAWLQNKLGVKKGDRIAVMTPNFIAFPVAFLGIARAGAVQVNVNPLYTPRELEHQLRDAGARAMLVFSGVSATVADIIGKPGIALEAVLTIAPGDGTRAQVPSPPVDARLQNTVAFADALREGDDLLFLQYTGGTTGLSKGASLSHRNLVANIQQYKAIAANTLRPGEEVVVTAIPLYHIFALMVNFITYFTVGAENWLVPNPRDMDGFVNVLQAARPTVFTGVNTLYAGLVAHPKIGEVDFSRLRQAAGGGAAVIEATSERWLKITGRFIREGYGLSETSPILSFNPENISAFNGTTGLPLPSTDIRLIREDGTDAPLGESGEVCAKGPLPPKRSGRCVSPDLQAHLLDRPSESALDARHVVARDGRVIVLANVSALVGRDDEGNGFFDPTFGHLLPADR